MTLYTLSKHESAGPEAAMKRYIGLIDGDEGGYGIVFPDLPGCVGMGVTIEEAIANGADAIRVWLQAAGRTGEAIPEPSSLDILRTDRDAASMWAEGALIVGLPLVRLKRRFTLPPPRSALADD